MDYKIGQVLQGTVSGVQDYGVFVSLDPKTQGLIHISECKNDKVEDVNKDFKVGQDLKVVVLDIDEYSKAISLSCRQFQFKESDLEPIKPKRIKKRFWTRSSVKIGFETIDSNMDKMKKEALSRVKK